MSNWINRIVGEAEVNPASIVANPRNWRVHPRVQLETLEDSLGSIGWIQKPIINKRSGHLIDGHLRVAAAAARHEPTIPVSYVDLDDAEERAALASLDPLAGMAVTDSEKLAELLDGLSMGSGALDQMFDDMREAAEVGIIAKATPGEDRNIGHDCLVKAALAVRDLLIVENALRLAGVANRGEALTIICEAFIHAKKGQLDTGPQGGAAPPVAEKDSGPAGPGGIRGVGQDLGARVQPLESGRRVRGKPNQG